MIKNGGPGRKSSGGSGAVRGGAECQNQKDSSTAPMLLRLLLLLLLPLRLLRGNNPKHAPHVGTERAGYARISTGISGTISKTGPRKRGQRPAKRRIMTS